MFNLSDEENEAVQQHFDNTIGDRKYNKGGFIDPKFEQLWPQVDEYNTKCREAEKYLLNMVQQLSQRTPEGYTELIYSLANAVHATILKGGVIAACTMDDMKYIAIVNYKPKEAENELSW